MLASIRSYLYSAGAALVAVFGALAWFYKAKSENATEAAREAENKAQAAQRQREQERDISSAQAEARKEAAEHAESIQESQARGDRSHGLSNDRLRDD